MKRRYGFVSNSSSSTFVLQNTDDQPHFLHDFFIDHWATLIGDATIYSDEELQIGMRAVYEDEVIPPHEAYSLHVDGDDTEALNEGRSFEFALRDHLLTMCDTSKSEWIYFGIWKVHKQHK